MRTLGYAIGFWLLLLGQAQVLWAEPMVNGQTAPNWILPNPDGEPVSLYHQAEEGHTTVMVFWATWCRNCKVLLPQINQMKKAMSGAPVSFYLLNVWEDGDPMAYVAEQNLQLPVVLRADNVAKRFDVTTTPGVIVVGPNKEILYQRPAGTTVEELEKQLRSVLDAAIAKTADAQSEAPSAAGEPLSKSAHRAAPASGEAANREAINSAQ